jgi:Xaa-Pro aminopeptidase
VLLNQARARRIMEQQQLDGLLGASFENVYYLSNLWSENFFVLPHQTQVLALVSRDRLGRPSVIAGLGEAANIFESCPGDAGVYLFGRFFRAVTGETPLTELEQLVKRSVVEAKPFADVVEATAAAIDDAGLARGTLAYDERGIFPQNIAALERRLPRTTFVPGWDTFRLIRAVKTDEELSRLKRVLALNERAIHAAMGVARVGATEQDLIEEFERVVVSAAARPVATQIAFGRRGGQGYVMRRRAPLKPADIIRFDVVCMLDGYNSDIARNFTLEEPTARARALYEAVLHGQEVAAKALRPGATASAVFEVGVNAIRESGIPDYRRHHIGHGIGLEVYDAPTLSPRDDMPIEVGMVFEVETPYYELGYGGLQPEDTVLVTDHGGEFLNGISRQHEVWT